MTKQPWKLKSDPKVVPYGATWHTWHTWQLEVFVRSHIFLTRKNLVITVSMPSIPLHILPTSPSQRPNPLPNLLQTPSGLAILEIQGSINTPPLSSADLPSDPSACVATRVGRLVFPHYASGNPGQGWMKTVHLYIGRHQRLTGEVKKLANPLAVIRRRDVARQEDAGRADGHGDELEIVDLVYYKLLFSSRPQPVGEASAVW